jgi:hypothetical protein
MASVPAAAEPKRERGHQAPANAAAAPPDPAVQRLREHQSAAARQPFGDECRTLLALSRYGVLSTLTVAKEAEGYPSGSIVGYADDVANGAPIFVFSTMSGHTRDVMADGRASLTVTAPGFEGAADARVCLTGTVRRVPDARVAAARERYLARHPDAFWVDFGDFTFWQMEDLKAIRLVGGFARAGSVPPSIYAAAKPDPVAGACAPQVAAANAKGDAAWVAAANAAIGVDAGLTAARVLSVDRLGANVAARRGQDALKLRLPFGAPAETPTAVGEALTALLRAGGAA